MREPVSKKPDSLVDHGQASERAQAASGPIKVFRQEGKWLVDYGSYANGYYPTRSQAVAEGKAAANRERRDLSIDDLS